MSGPDRHPHEPSPRVKTAFAFGVAALALYLSYWVQHVFFITIVAVLIAIVLDALAGLGMRWLKLRRSPAVVIAAVIFLGGVGGTFALMSVPLLRQGGEFAKALPEQTQKLRSKLDDIREDYPFTAGLIPSSKQEEKPAEPGKAVKTVAIGASRVIEGMITCVSIFFLAIFFAMDPERYTRGLAYLLPGKPLDERVALLERIGEALRSYLVALAIYMVAMAALWAVGLWLIGIDYALLFGVIGGLVEVVPYVGPLFGLVPPLLVAVGKGGAAVGLVLGLYLVLHVIEGYILVPLLMKKREKLPPPIVLLSILAFGAAFGFLGVLLAVPLGTVVYVWVKEGTLGIKDEEEPKEAPACGAVVVERVPFRPGFAGGV